jgi:SAM-dependent methyltransferase
MIDVTGKRGISLGCGLVYQAPDILHVDCRPTPVVDVVVDLNCLPWNFPSSWAEVVYALDIIEHLNDRIGAINEIWRLLKPQGLTYIRMPDYRHAQAYRALDHQCYATLDSLDLWVRNTEYNRGYGYYTRARFDKIDANYCGLEVCWTLRKAMTDDGLWE